MMYRLTAVVDCNIGNVKTCVFTADEEPAVSEREEQGAPPMLPVQHQGAVSHTRSSLSS